jgi:hypothetical protein
MKKFKSNLDAVLSNKDIDKKYNQNKKKKNKFPKCSDSIDTKYI